MHSLGGNKEGGEREGWREEEGKRRGRKGWRRAHSASLSKDGYDLKDVE